MKVALVALALIWTILLHSAFGFYFRPAVIARKVSPKRLYGLQGTETTTDRTVHEGLPVGVKRSDLCSEFKNDIFIRPVPVCVISKPNVTEDVNVSLNNPHVRKESVLGPRPIKDDTNIDMRLALVNHNISTSISSENVTKLLLIQKLRSLRTATVVALNDKFGQWVDSFLVRLVWEFVSDKDIQLIDTEIRDVEVVKELYITSAVLQVND